MWINNAARAHESVSVNVNQDGCTAADVYVQLWDLTGFGSLYLCSSFCHRDPWSSQTCQHSPELTTVCLVLISRPVCVPLSVSFVVQFM